LEKNERRHHQKKKIRPHKVNSKNAYGHKNLIFYPAQIQQVRKTQIPPKKGNFPLFGLVSGPNKIGPCVKKAFPSPQHLASG
jgi:hypothetical protein